MIHVKHSPPGMPGIGTGTGTPARSLEALTEQAEERLVRFLGLGVVAFEVAEFIKQRKLQKRPPSVRKAAAPA